MTNRPLLIVLTPVRNEAWILPAFLKATSLWADCIIIADQNSTDGSREIAMQYKKCIVIDNNAKEMHQAATRRLLFDKAAEVCKGRRALVFALDADEFLAYGGVECLDWQKLVYSEPNTAFLFRWINVLPGNKYTLANENWYLAAHVGDGFFGGQYPDFNIHEWRLPWPSVIDESKTVRLKHFDVLHFAVWNKERARNKIKFYQVSSLHRNLRGYTAVGLYRQYHSLPCDEKYEELPDGVFDFYKRQGVDILSEIKSDEIGQYYLDEMVKFIKEDGATRYARLDIWDKDFEAAVGVKNPAGLFDKLLLAYLRRSNKYSKNILIRAVDKCLKKLNV